MIKVFRVLLLTFIFPKWPFRVDREVGLPFLNIGSCHTRDIRFHDTNDYNVDHQQSHHKEAKLQLYV